MKIIWSRWHYKLLKPSSLFARTCWRLVRKLTPAKMTVINYKFFPDVLFELFYCFGCWIIRLILFKCLLRKISGNQGFFQKSRASFDAISFNLPECRLLFWVWACLILIIWVIILSSFLKILLTEVVDNFSSLKSVCFALPPFLSYFYFLFSLVILISDAADFGLL